MKPRRVSWSQPTPGALILKWQNFDDQQDVTTIDRRMEPAHAACAVLF
jgi:hypothetical protein